MFAEPTDVMDLSNIAVLSMVVIISQTLGMLQMLQRLSETKKANIAEPTDMVELSNVAMLSYVANITVPSKYCNMLQSYKKKNK